MCGREADTPRAIGSTKMSICSANGAWTQLNSASRRNLVERFRSLDVLCGNSSESLGKHWGLKGMIAQRPYVL